MSLNDTRELDALDAFDENVRLFPRRPYLAWPRERSQSPVRPAQSPKRQKVAFSGAAMDDIDAKWYEDDHSTVNDTSPPLSIAAPRAEVKPSYQAAQKLRALKRELKVAVGDDIHVKCPRAVEEPNCSICQQNQINGRPPEGGRSGLTKA